MCDRTHLRTCVLSHMCLHEFRPLTHPVRKNVGVRTCARTGYTCLHENASVGLDTRTPPSPPKKVRMCLHRCAHMCGFSAENDTLRVCRSGHARVHVRVRVGELVGSREFFAVLSGARHIDLAS